MLWEPNRESSILDLLFTNKPGLVKSHQTIPGISDHHMIVVDSNIKASMMMNSKPARKIYKYARADREKAPEETRKFTCEHLPTFDQRSVEDNWKLRLKSYIEDVLANTHALN